VTGGILASHGNAAPASEPLPLMRAASPGEVALVVDVLEMAGRGHLERGPWDLMFPDARERRRALAHIATDAPLSWCHRSLFHVAEAGGQAAAALVCFAPEDVGETSLAAPLFETFTWLGWQPERVAETVSMIEPYAACFPDMPAATWIVENVGTRENARRRGLVRALVDRALDEGRRRGYTRAQISCLVGNDAAQRAYERAGFQVVEQKCSEEFERLVGAAGFSRMTMSL